MVPHNEETSGPGLHARATLTARQPTEGCGGGWTKSAHVLWMPPTEFPNRLENFVGNSCSGVFEIGIRSLIDNCRAWLLPEGNSAQRHNASWLEWMNVYVVLVGRAHTHTQQLRLTRKQIVRWKWLQVGSNLAHCLTNDVLFDVLGPCPGFSDILTMRTKNPLDENQVLSARHYARQICHDLTTVPTS